MVARTHVQMVFVLPHAFPPNTQMLHPEVPATGKETNVTFTVGVVVWNGLGLPLKRTPAACTAPVIESTIGNCIHCVMQQQERLHNRR